MLGGYAIQYPWAQCKYCGKAQDRDCEAVTCPLCASVVCLNHNTCRVCHYGWLLEYSSLSRPNGAACGYSGCAQRAIANAPRVKQVCADHVSRVKVNRIALTEHVARQTANRDCGGGWERWKFVA